MGSVLRSEYECATGCVEFNGNELCLPRDSTIVFYSSWIQFYSSWIQFNSSWIQFYSGE